jgi:hypothetical protein
MEGVVVALLGRKPEELSPKDYMDTLAKLDWKPNVIDLETRRLVAESAK